VFWVRKPIEAEERGDIMTSLGFVVIEYEFQVFLQSVHDFFEIYFSPALTS
jgi:hypothetical protein